METPFPPFDPDGDPEKGGKPSARPARLRDIPLRALFPNLLTLLAICSGLTAIRFAIEDKIEWAVAAIIFAGFLDGIDGRVARFLKSSSRFGAQMDSLADFVNFGVAPAMVLYFTMMKDADALGWVAALIYTICAGLRLARFNVAIDNPSGPSWQKAFFVGVPAPAAALVVLLPVYGMLLGLGNHPLLSWAAILFSLGVGFLMVSNLPTFSGKEVGQKIRTDFVLPLLIAAVFLAGVLLTYPWATLAASAFAYLVSIPFAKHNWDKKAAAPKRKRS